MLSAYSLYIKIGLAILVVLMGMYIKMLSSQISELETKLQTSEETNKTLNSTIESQNKSIIESNAKFETVQKQLTEANGLNKALTREFKGIKEDIKNRPIPKTCDEAVVEMVDTGRKVGKKWKK